MMPRDASQCCTADRFCFPVWSLEFDFFFWNFEFFVNGIYVEGALKTLCTILLWCSGGEGVGRSPFKGSLRNPFKGALKES